MHDSTQMKTMAEYRRRTLGGLLLLLVAGMSLQAQSSGPAQPEFSTPPVGAGANVDPFSGAFSFGLPVVTVPGPDGAGYSLTLSYRSGASPEMAPSWVGYGWSLNAGSITRDVNGFPDDWKNEVRVWNKRPDVVTISGSVRVGVEITSFEEGLTRFTPAYKQTTVFNSETGYRRSNSFGLDLKGIGSFGFGYSDGQEVFSGAVSPDIFSFTPGMYKRDNASRQYPGFSESISRTGKSAWMNVAHATIFGNSLSEFSSPLWSPRLNSDESYSVNFGQGLQVVTSPGLPIGPDFGAIGNFTLKRFLDVYSTQGVGYMRTADAGVSDLRDYSVEKSNAFRAKNRYLPIPFTGADMYSVTGGAPSGQLRLYARSLGQFRPDYVHNEMSISQDHPERMIGGRVGFGMGLGVGSNSLKVSNWDDDGLNDAYAFPASHTNDGYFMRYRGDGGGNLLAASNDSALCAAFYGDVPLIQSSIYPKLNNGERVGRSLYVGFNTNREMLQKTDKLVPYLAYERNPRQIDYEFIERDQQELHDQIGEVAVISGGARYCYGLPVYTRQEQRLSLGLANRSADSAAHIKSRLTAYAWLDTNRATRIFGRTQAMPYATTYLLTSITGADYLDITGDGPTRDDIGAWVKFNYRRAAGNRRKTVLLDESGWFHWRAPYNGLLYSRGDLSDPGDDMGSYSAGQREQYYLESIETKTHIAYFVTNATNVEAGGMEIKGSGNARMDAYQAPYFLDSIVSRNYQEQAAGDSTASSAEWTWQGGQKKPAPNFSEVLERIELYAKDSSGIADSLLSTTFFEYDYSLRRGMPNSVTPHKDSTVRLGMLTLKRVWGQSQRVYHARISPYEFEYEYPTKAEYPAAMRTKYPAAVSFADSLSAAEQNPAYGRADLDAWGMYQHGGGARYAAMRTWTNQSPDAGKFDPAAWQLKRIHTPTGGELHVQYEQNDYAHVQNKPAHAMASLMRTFGDSTSQDGETSGRYYVNLADVGVADTDRVATMRHLSAVNRQYVESKDRIYLRFLYALVGDTAKFGNPEYNSGYISAYARVAKAGVDSAVIGGTKRYALYVKLGLNGDSTVPKRVCHDYVKWNKRGRLQGYSPVHIGKSIATILALNQRYGEAGYDESEHCRAVDYANSYLRIPLVAAKKGGGVRVKRLLTLDRGIVNDSMLYGAEYEYRQYDKDREEFISSGVAANEPALAREENILFNADSVRNLPGFETKVVAGDDVEQYEGPVGASLLPGPSVGYARVLVRNIHTGRTNPGFSVQEFVTARDFPFLRFDTLLGPTVDATEITGTRKPTNPLWDALGGALAQAVGDTLIENVLDGVVGIGFSRRHNVLKLLQGYRFILNDMHGRSRSSAVYGGDPDDPTSWQLTGLTQYEYFHPGEKLPVLNKPGDSIRYATLGKEMEVTMDSRSALDHTIDGTVHGDASVVPVTPFLPILVSGAAKLSIADDDLYTHVTSKVIRYPAFVKRVLTFADGAYHMAENVAFDSLTGAPSVTRTSDSYDRLALEHSPSGHRGLYHSYSFPARELYPALGQKAFNQRAEITNTGGVTITKSVGSLGEVTLTFGPGYSAAMYAAMARVQVGDMIRLTKTSDSTEAGYYHVAEKTGMTVKLAPVRTGFANTNSATGTVNILVLESGRTNELGAALGGIATYGETAAEVAAASNFGRDNPSSFTARQRLADTLNAVLARGGGLVYPAELAGCGAIFLKEQAGPDTCIAMADTLWLSPRADRLVLARGAFAVDDSICGTPTNPHPMVNHLNAYLDSLWGYHIDTALAHDSQCDSTDYTWRHYTSKPAGYQTLLDSMYSKRFDCVNYRDNYWIGDLVPEGPGMDTLVDGFRRGTNAYFSATGMIDLHGSLAAHTVRTRMWVSDCDGSGKAYKVSLWHQHTLNGGSLDTTIVYTNMTKSQIDAKFPYTTAIGKFKQNTNGELTYQAIGFGNVTRKAYGIKFIHADTLTTRLACADTLVYAGGAGRFVVDDEGNLRYEAADANVAEQSVPCLELCPTTDRRHYTHSRVIAASASTLEDSVEISSADYPTLPAGLNAFERGAAGRYRGVRGFAYRTTIKGGARAVAGERNYRDAGVFDSFRLFNWKNPAQNDTMAWMPGDTVTRFGPLGEALETRDRLGISSTVKLGYSGRLPAMTAGNAEYHTVGFTSFEDDSLYSASVRRGVAHAGYYSLRVAGLTPVSTGLFFDANSHVLAKGVLVKFWMKTDAALNDTGTALVQVRFHVSGDTSWTRDIRPANRVARTGEWTLFELEQRGITVGANDRVHLSFVASGLASDSAFVDDIKVQPMDAAAACYVYCGRTYRALAAFDDDHFAAYTQYNAEGVPVRTLVETARGMKTVAEAHTNIPKIARPGAGTVAGGGDEDPWGAVRSRPRVKESEGVGGDIDLDIEMQNSKVKIQKRGSGEVIQDADALQEAAQRATKRAQEAEGRVRDAQQEIEDVRKPENETP